MHLPTPPIQANKGQILDAAWSVLKDEDASTDDLLESCYILEAHARDHRRYTAADILALLQGEGDV